MATSSRPESSGTAHIDLGGPWRHRTEPTEVGLNSGSREGESPWHSVDLDDSSWGWIDLPCHWSQSNQDALRSYWGSVWFRKEVELDEGDLEGCLWLRFEGVADRLEAWINGQHVGGSGVYYQTIEVSATAHLRPGKNCIALRVESLRPSSTHGPNLQGLLPHRYDASRPTAGFPEPLCLGGVWNSISLIRTGEVRISGVHIAPRVDGPSGIVDLDLRCQLVSPVPCNVTFTVEVEPANFSEAAQPITPVSLHRVLQPGEQLASTSLQVPEPRLWTVYDRGFPHLYRLTVRAEVEGSVSDTYEGRFGFRELVIDEEWDWRLNGEPFFPRGTHFVPTRWLGSYTRDQIVRDVALLKQANVNAVRLTSHVNRQELYEALDEAGILVWQDFPLCGPQPEVVVDSEEFRLQCRSAVGVMVERLRNHPCLALWCGRDAGVSERFAFDEQLAAWFRELDPVRKAHPATSGADQVFVGWIEGSIADYASLPGKPMVAAFGAQALPDAETLKEIVGEHHASLSGITSAVWEEHGFDRHGFFEVARIDPGKTIRQCIKNSQEYQARLLKFAIEQYRLQRCEQVKGVFQKQFVDGWKGLSDSVLDFHRRPKAGFEALQIAYQPILPVLRWRKTTYRPLAELEVSVSVVNDTPQALEDTEVEMLLEVEKGVLYTWRLRLRPIPANHVLHEAMISATPHFHLYENVTFGRGTVYLRLRDATGRLLSQNWDELTIVE